MPPRREPKEGYDDFFSQLNTVLKPIVKKKDNIFL